MAEPVPRTVICELQFENGKAIGISNQTVSKIPENPGAFAFPVVHLPLSNPARGCNRL
jgi:hypothetical protein